MHDAKAAYRIRAQIEKFSGNLCDGLPKVGARMVREVLYGMQARGSVRLSEIARSLREETALKKVIERLGRQLERPGLREQVRENLLRQAAPLVGEETLLVLDPTDVTKRYARKMEHLTTVRDGSEKKLDTGYWCMTVVAAHRSSAQVIPLYQELYSQDAPDFTSENDELLEAIDAVDSATGDQGVWVIDRGGDRGNILEPLLERGRKLLVRLQGDRHLITNPGKRSDEALGPRDRRLDGSAPPPDDRPRRPGQRAHSRAALRRPVPCACPRCPRSPCGWSWSRGWASTRSCS